MSAFAPWPPLFPDAREHCADNPGGNDAKVLELPRDFAMMRQPRRGGFPGRTTMDSA